MYIYWKVRNVGYEAIRRNCIRGQIKKGIDYLNESTNFYGPHYVECYIIKDGICVARDKISVSSYYSAIKKTNFNYFVFLHEKTKQIVICPDIFL